MSKVRKLYFICLKMPVSQYIPSRPFPSHLLGRVSEEHSAVTDGPTHLPSSALEETEKKKRNSDMRYSGYEK